MEDLISRQAAIDAFEKGLTVGKSNGKYETICSAVTFVGAKQILDELPSVQPEIIHCRDCKHAIRWTDIDGTKGLQCNVTFDNFGYGADVEPDHYCGYAERRKDG